MLVVNGKSSSPVGHAAAVTQNAKSSVMRENIMLKKKRVYDTEGFLLKTDFTLEMATGLCFHYSFRMDNHFGILLGIFLMLMTTTRT